MTRVAPRMMFLLALLLLCVGCGKGAATSDAPSVVSTDSLPTSTPAPAGPYSGAVTWALYRDVASLDPIFAFDYPENTAVAAMCDTLLRQSPDGSPAPGISSLSYDNPTTLVFTIRPDVTFWDGKPLTSADVVYSLERARNPKYAGYYNLVFNRVKTITATSRLKVTITLSKPDFWLPGELSSTPGFITEKAFTQRAGKSYGTVGTGAMCSGPFKLKSWKTGEPLKVEPNTAYWDTSLRPKVAEIDFTGVSSDSALTTGLQTGQIQGVYPSAALSTLKVLESSSDLHVYRGPSYASDAFIVSSTKGPLGSVKVRQALPLALDRQGYIDTVYHGAAQLPRTLANPGSWGYGRPVFQKGWDALPLPTTNLAAARKLLKQAGAEGSTINIGMTSELNSINTEALMFQSAGEQLGLHVKLHAVSAANYINFFVDPGARKGIDGFFTLNYSDYADPAGLYQTFVVPGGSQNYDGFSDPRITQLLEQARATADPTKRAAVVVAAQKLIMEQLPWIPVALPDTTLILNTKLTGAPPTFPYLFAPWLAKLGATE
jgi:peptide/nickel transport system substrate-binding protein